jgi:hypothetical protein
MKKIMYSIFILLMLIITSLTLYAQSIPKDSLYLGQTPPGNTPKIFNLPIPDNFFAAERIAISNDDKNIYYQDLDGYTEMDGKPHTARINHYSFTNGKWNGPFILFESVGGPALSITEDTMYLEKGLKEGYYSIKTGQGWSIPKRFLTKLKIVHYLQVTNSGNYYISSYPANNIGGIDRSRLFIKGTDTTITSLGLPVNSAGHDLDYFVSQDESYMILVASDNSLCISFHKKDGSWTNPKNLGKEINFGIAAWGPYVTKDNKYLFYTTGTKPDYSDCRIYWVRISNKIDSLKTTNYEPYLKGQIKTQTAELNKIFKFTIPENTFIDDDGNNTLTYSATLSDGNPLPSWLSLNPITRTFSGTPTNASTISVKVTAADKANVSISCTFTIKVLNADGTVNSGIASGKPYFGQTLPAETPVIFAPDVLNPLSEFVETTAFSLDGTLFFAGVGNADYSGGKLYYSKLVNNVWTSFAEAPFISDFVFSNEPVFSADGKSLIFTGKKATTDNMDLWIVTYTNNTWDVPVKLPSPINSDANDFRGSYMTDGTFYFTSNRSGMNQVYKSKSPISAVELLGAPVNTRAYEGDPCIAPDGHFLIFHSGRAGGIGRTDLYVSFKNEQGSWGTPINLGPKFNTPGDEYGAHLSSDGKYLFFTRHTPQGNSIFWVSISAIEKLK